MNLVVSKNMAVATTEERCPSQCLWAEDVPHPTRFATAGRTHHTRYILYVDIVSRQPEEGSGVSLVQDSVCGNVENP